MYTTDFAYDGPIFLVPLSPSYPSSPVSRFIAGGSYSYTRDLVFIVKPCVVSQVQLTLRLEDPLELFVKRREFLPGSGFLSRRDRMT